MLPQAAPVGQGGQPLAAGGLRACGRAFPQRDTLPHPDDTVSRSADTVVTGADRAGLSLAHRIGDPSQRIIHNLHYLTSSHYGGRSLPSSAHAILGLSPGLPGPSAS